jgi:hypothetical protein
VAGNKTTAIYGDLSTGDGGTINVGSEFHNPTVQYPCTCPTPTRSPPPGCASPKHFETAGYISRVAILCISYY